jgi:hypothetical protein
MTTHTEDRAKLARVIYVAGFCPNTATPDGGATGGFEWRRDPKAAAKILNEWIEEDCTLRDSHEDLLSDYVFRAVRVPEGVSLDDGPAVTAWLDECRELWETHSQQAPRPFNEVMRNAVRMSEEGDQEILAFVRAVIDTDAHIDVAGVVLAMMKGDKYSVAANDGLAIWARYVLPETLFESIFAVEAP